VSIAFGWQGVFLSLAVISLGAAIGAGVLFRLGRPAQGRAQARAGATP
jgi:hypothetical protein